MTTDQPSSPADTRTFAEKLEAKQAAAPKTPTPRPQMGGRVRPKPTPAPDNNTGPKVSGFAGIERILLANETNGDA